MSHFIWIMLFTAALVGHAAFWIGLFNRTHGTRLNNRLLRRSSYPLIAAGILCLPLILFFQTARQAGDQPLTAKHFLQGTTGLYFWCSTAVFLVTAAFWSHRRFQEQRVPTQLIRQKSRRFDHGPVARLANRNRLEQFFGAIPGNQIYQCVVEEREILLPSISSRLDGTTITHLSDFHFTGNICREYFEQIVATANDLNSDIVAITGDFIDQSRCWSWLEDILGSLRAPLGVYFILGNHDERIGREAELRSELQRIGMIDVAHRWQTIPLDSQAIHLAGNELPWFGTGMQLPEVPAQFSPGDCRILLSHSPDQWRWAQRRGFDLVLAGHTHGGQIRLPGIGPIISPSLHGVRYASGLFVEQEKVMVVSRGISGEEPIRLNCPPEIGKITLRAPQTARHRETSRPEKATTAVDQQAKNPIP